MSELSAMLAARNTKGECPDGDEIERDSRHGQCASEWHLKSFVLRDVMRGWSAGIVEQGPREAQSGIQRRDPWKTRMYRVVRPISTALVAFEITMPRESIDFFLLTRSLQRFVSAFAFDLRSFDRHK